jgi:hypothetical protein
MLPAFRLMALLLSLVAIDGNYAVTLIVIACIGEDHFHRQLSPGCLLAARVNRRIKGAGPVLADLGRKRT